MDDSDNKVFKIYYSDLNRKAKKRLLKLIGVSSPKETNCGLDILPLGCYDVEIEEVQIVEKRRE